MLRRRLLPQPVGKGLDRDGKEGTRFHIFCALSVIRIGSCHVLSRPPSECC